MSFKVCVTFAKEDSPGKKGITVSRVKSETAAVYHSPSPADGSEEEERGE